MAALTGESDRVVLAMRPGRDRELLAQWLDAQPGYAVETVSPEEALPETYDICLLDVPTFRAARPAVEQRVADADPVYLPHVLLISPKNAISDPEDRLPGGDSVADSVINELLTLPVEKAVLRRRVENLLGTRRASVELAEREEQYQRLVELTPEGILLVDDGDIVYANAAADELLDGGRATLEGKPVAAFVSEAEPEALADILERVESAEEGDSTEFTELPLRTTDGETVDVAIAGVPVTYEGKQIAQLLVRDLSEEKRRRQQLHLFGRAVESANHGIIITDARQTDNPITYANEGFRRITGYPLGEILGRNCRFLQGRKTSEEARRRMREAVDAGEPVTVDVLNYRRDGTTFWNRVDITPIYNDDGLLTHFLGFQRDITDRIRRKQRLAVLNRILRHNVRNKTNVIQGYAEAIRDGSQPAEGAAAKIEDAAAELLTISEQIREFDTILEQAEEDTGLVDLADCITEEIARIEGASPEATVSYEGPDRLQVAAHRSLQPALRNVFDLLATPSEPEFEVRLGQEWDGVSLDIVDYAGALAKSELVLVDSGIESSLDHLQGLELWLLKWAVEQSDGVFDIDTVGAPHLRLTFSQAE